MRLTRRAFVAGSGEGAAAPSGPPPAPTPDGVCPPPRIGDRRISPAACVVKGGVYQTGFDRDENPLSEGGRWVHLDSTLTPCRTVGGVVFGTQRGGAYDDSNAYMTGFGNDHEVEAQVWLRPGAAARPNREVEILLRWHDHGRLRQTPYGVTRSAGYEVNWSHVGAYLILGRFKGDELARAQAKHPPRTGDRLRARIEGRQIRVWINDQPVIDHVDDHPTLHIAEGHPGIGFFVDGGASNLDFGFDAVTIRAL